jgi:dihydroorotase
MFAKSDPGYLITGGQVYVGDDAALARGDVRVREGLIHEIGRDLSSDGDVVVPAGDCIVAPGLIDLHVHVFSGVGIYSIDAAAAGLARGVTTMLDTGTAGALTYPAFERFVAGPAAEDVYALLNISMIGAIQGHPQIIPYLGDLTEIRHAHVDSAIECISRHPSRILGTKVRLTSALANYAADNEWAGLRGAVRAARHTGLRCMIHHARSLIPLEEALGELQRGDIYTHCFHPYEDNGFDNAAGGAPRPAVVRARERGVIFDVGHGMGAFSWNVAEAAMARHGFWPDTISTDLHQFNVNGPVFDLPTTLTKFLCLGMPLAQVLRAATSTPADVMGLGHKSGRLVVGRQADVVILRLVAGDWQLTDTTGGVRAHHELLTPVKVFKSGQLHDCQAPAIYSIGP